jgi:mRNA interferase RelE/StbE
LPYSIRFAPAAARQMRKLAAAERSRLAPHIDSLAGNPRPDGCKKLKAAQGGLYRIRAGDLRIVYRIEELELIVLEAAIGRRRDIYEELKRLR